MYNLSVDNPNFSIIVPSSCNARCDFCFWDRQLVDINRKEYLERLWDTISSLPSDFSQCSITGGEPTMLPWLRGILLLVRERFDKVILSTNGWKLMDHIYIANDHLIDHLNISRHDIGYIKNSHKFKTTLTLTDDEINRISSYFQRRGIDTTFNCVLPPNFNDIDFIFDYISYAKSLNINYVAFRKDHSNLDFMGVECNELMSDIVESHSCPVCRNDVRYINGMKTTWKYSVKEPSNDLGGIYELIYHQNGNVTSDWSGINTIDVNEIIPLEECYEEKR